MTETELAIAYARSIWPLGFTKHELRRTLQNRTALSELRRLRAIENTGVRRNQCVVWRYKPYQLQLPLGDE